MFRLDVKAFAAFLDVLPTTVRKHLKQWRFQKVHAQNGEVVWRHPPGVFVCKAPLDKIENMVLPTSDGESWTT